MESKTKTKPKPKPKPLSKCNYFMLMELKSGAGPEVNLDTLSTIYIFPFAFRGFLLLCLIIKGEKPT